MESFKNFLNTCFVYGFKAHPDHVAELMRSLTGVFGGLEVGVGVRSVRFGFKKFGSVIWFSVL